MLDIMAGPDNADPLSIERAETSYVEASKGDVKGLRVAWSPNLGLGHVDPEVLAVCLDALSAFEELGARITEATPQWGNPSESMWNGIWVPGFASEYDLLDWENQRGEVDDNLIEIMHEAERLTGVDVGAGRRIPRRHVGHVDRVHERLRRVGLADPGFGHVPAQSVRAVVARRCVAA